MRGIYRVTYCYTFLFFSFFRSRREIGVAKERRKMYKNLETFPETLFLKNITYENPTVYVTCIIDFRMQYRFKNKQE